jgi:hypothetical protein
MLIRLLDGCYISWGGIISQGGWSICAPAMPYVLTEASHHLLLDAQEAPLFIFLDAQEAPILLLLDAT